MTIIEHSKTKSVNDPVSYLSRNIAVDPSSNLESSFQALANAVVPKFADGCVVDLRRKPDKLLRVGVAHVCPFKREILKTLMETYPIDMRSPLPAMALLNQGHPLLIQIDEYGLETLCGLRPAGYREEILKFGLRSLIVAPLMMDSGCVGIVVFLTMTESQRSFTHEDLPMALELARKASVALENAKLFEEAREAVQARDEFLSIASHELKTPITAMKLRTELALRRMQINDPETRQEDFFKNFLCSTNRQLDQLTSLVDTMLDISRIVHGKLTLEKKPVNLATLIRDILERSEDQFHSSGSRYNITEKKLAVGNWDPLKIEQVLTNLITNAMKYGRGKPVDISIDISNQMARLEVTDQGVGIAEKDLLRIFQRFERAVTLSDIGGLGLGLYISQQIVAAHQGNIWVESKIDRGSTFIVELPLDTHE
jgi:signal transduction histidine kinase